MSKYTVSFWRDEIKSYTKEFEDFTKAGEKIVDKYRIERKATDSDSQFNILWSNVQTIKPAVYSRPPKVQVSRRFKDRSDPARVASSILERAIEFELSQYNDYHSALSNVLEDRLLPGRGVAWIRYEPTIEEVELQITDDIDGEMYPEMGMEADTLEKVTAERCPIDYIYWKDFAHSDGRTWEEITWVARRVYLDKEDGKERFGDKFEKVPCDYISDFGDKKKNSADSDNVEKKAEIWEIWCKKSKKVYWIAKSHNEILDEKDDPLELDGFFPCPKPIYSTVTTSSLVPVPDYRQYQDQAEELNKITHRISVLTDALRIAGLYPGGEPELSQLLGSGKDNHMIAVKDWRSLIEKGGMSRAVDFMPLGEIVRALQQLYVQRDACKQTIYEITGLSDIFRGASDPNETATAQGMKAQYGSLRIRDTQADMARFARDLLRMKAEIMALKYQPEILVEMSGIANTDDVQFIEPAIQLIKNDTLRNFNIDIETDTLVEMDEQQEKQDRVEFLTATSGFMQQIFPVVAQDQSLLPVMLQMLMFGVRGFKVGRELEGMLDQMVDTMNQKQKQEQENPQPPQPTPEELQIQAEQQAATQQMQLDQAKMQADMQAKQMQIDADMQKHMATLQANAETERVTAEATLQAAREHEAAETARLQLRIEADLAIANLNGQYRVLDDQNGRIDSANL